MTLSTQVTHATPPHLAAETLSATTNFTSTWLGLGLGLEPGSGSVTSGQGQGLSERAKVRRASRPP